MEPPCSSNMFQCNFLCSLIAQDRKGHVLQSCIYFVSVFFKSYRLEMLLTTLA